MRCIYLLNVNNFIENFSIRTFFNEDLIFFEQTGKPPISLNRDGVNCTKPKKNERSYKLRAFGPS